MIPNDKQMNSLIKKIQKKVDTLAKERDKKVLVTREVLEEEPSLDVFNEMKKRPHTS